MSNHDDNSTVSVWGVIPVYNNAATILSVAERILKQQIDGVLVIDDGSNDCNVAETLSGIAGITVLAHEHNMGKGKAIQTALKYLNERNVTYMITIDGDGQHYPEDIEHFLPVLAEDDHSIIIGVRDFSARHIPGSSNVGRKFSNFWIMVETGCKVADAQSGFRAYPVKYISQLHFISSYYNFEIEVLTKAAWAGITLKSVPVRVWYPENPEDRVSSFRPFLDNFRITLINIHLVGLRILPIPHKQLVRTADDAKSVKDFIRHPLLALRELLVENATPCGLAAAAGVGAFFSILPVPGFHTAAIIYAAVRLHLNKIMAVNIQHFFMPPLIPLLCIETGYFIRHGQWLTEISFDTVCKQLGSRIIEWWIGAAVLVIPLSLLTALAVYVAAVLIRRCKRA
jgi:glycosyltransferase involved in cell wall biosynthesis